MSNYSADGLENSGVEDSKSAVWILYRCGVNVAVIAGAVEDVGIRFFSFVVSFAIFRLKFWI